jgi:hypothetical protein
MNKKEFYENIGLEDNGAIKVIISNQPVIDAQPILNAKEFYENVKINNGKLIIKIKA